MATLTATLLICTVSSSACTMVYVGSDLTDDGSSFMARSEDYSNSYNKIAYVNQHGKYAAGSVYEGCYGFTHTFTHDSYAYTAPSDDNLSGVCPDCDGTHEGRSCRHGYRIRQGICHRAERRPGRAGTHPDTGAVQARCVPRAHLRRMDNHHSSHLQGRRRCHADLQVLR